MRRQEQHQHILERQLFANFQQQLRLNITQHFNEKELLLMRAKALADCRSVFARPEKMNEESTITKRNAR